MPPRLNVWSACRALAIRSRPLAQQPCIAAPLARRGLADITPTNPDLSGSHPALAKFGQTHAMELSENEKALEQLRQAAYGVNPYNPAVEGHKFGIPEVTSKMNHKNRYNDVVTQMTKLLMRSGKLAKAQRDMAMILNFLRSSPPPKVNPLRPLLPGSPPPEDLPLNPALYLELAIDSVAPLIRVRGFKGLAGGGRSLEVPVPIAVRQRRRAAFGWILDAVNKKPSKGSGRGQFPHRVAEEVVAVVEGRSTVWEKRQQVHKVGTAARANLSSGLLRGMTIA